MSLIDEKFSRLGVDNAPGQESSRVKLNVDLKGSKLAGSLVDFSHGDVDAFQPVPTALDNFIEGVQRGGVQAYTEYKGGQEIRTGVAERLSDLVGKKIDPINKLLITPGTQGALFLAIGSTMSNGDKVAIVQPDYFANRKIVEFLDGEVVPIELDFQNETNRAGINLNQLESAFENGVKLFVFSNPNNPAGMIYSSHEISEIAKLATKYNVTVIVDELYARQIFDGRNYTHLCADGNISSENLITIIGPSKTESLSGYRLGVAFGSTKIIDRMEKLQAIVSLRASGYNQAVLASWLAEPKGWMEKRVAQHQSIRNDLVKKFQASKRFEVRATEAGSYLFPRITNLEIPIEDFVKVLQHQANVLVTPGTEFGPQFTDRFRINFSQNHKSAIEAVERIIEIVERY